MSSEPPCFHPVGFRSEVVTVSESGFAPIGYSRTVNQLITAHFALADAVALNEPPATGTT